MLKTINQQESTVADLAEGVKVNTSIPSAHHAALRCGFAGYPLNPRWNGQKVYAWNTGRQLKQGLFTGEMVIRATDSMIVPAWQQNHHSDTEPTPKATVRLWGGYQLKFGAFRLG